MCVCECVCVCVCVWKGEYFRGYVWVSLCVCVCAYKWESSCLYLLHFLFYIMSSVITFFKAIWPL